MQIFINGKEAALKEGYSFEYVSENRLFSGSDGYSLNIEFPLKGCPQNLAIFGDIDRADVALRKAVLDCEIRCEPSGLPSSLGQARGDARIGGTQLRAPGFIKSGCVTVTEFTETDVKTQFLDGRSEQNFSSAFDDIYINELNLGAPASVYSSAVAPAEAWQGLAAGKEAVALPWVSIGSANYQNLPVYDERTDEYSWDEDTVGLSWMPYLLVIAKRVCSAVGYAHDFSAWEEDESRKYFIVCNAIPFAWGIPQYARALPHWTVEEFFEELGMFLGMEFDFDHRAKRITCSLTASLEADAAPVELTEVIDGFSQSVTAEDPKCGYLGAKNVAYKASDHPMQKFYSCQWYIDAWGSQAVVYPTMARFLADVRAGRQSLGIILPERTAFGDCLFYVSEVGSYFALRAVSRTENGVDRMGRAKYIYKKVVQPVNSFGPRVAERGEDADSVELSVVPACVDCGEEGKGRSLFLSFGSSDESDSVAESQFGRNNGGDRFLNSRPVYMLEMGEEKAKSEFYDRIYVAFWDGAKPLSGELPFPDTEDIEVAEDKSSYRINRFSMRLNSPEGLAYAPPHRLDETRKAAFSFLADSIPDVRSVFFIKGKRYLCEKITAAFSQELGMSRLLKGVFWPIKD